MVQEQIPKPQAGHATGMTLLEWPRWAPHQKKAFSTSALIRQQAGPDTPAGLTRPCRKCSAPVPLPVSPCPSCSALLPLRPDLSLHSLLDLSSPTAKAGADAATGELDVPAELAKLEATGYDLQPRALRQTMLFRQRDLHPDKYSGQAEEVELAKELSGRVNGAYAVLSDPLRRAEYIVSL